MIETINSAPSLPASIVNAADPCLAFVTTWSAVTEGCNTAPEGMKDSFYEAHCEPFEWIAAFGCIPSPTTMEGAAAALRKVIEFDDIEGQDRNLVLAALGFLTREFATAEPDPMAEAVSVYLATLEEQRTCETRGDDEAANAASNRAVPLWSAIQKTPPAITSHAGAVAAIQFVATDSNWVDEQHAHLLNLALVQLEKSADMAPRYEAPTPFALRMAAFRQDCDRYNTATTDDDGPNPDEALFADLNSGKAALSSVSDAVEAMRYVLEEDVIEDVFAEQMARYVLAFLEGKGPTQGQPGGAGVESIGSMMRELRAIHDRPLSEAEDDSDTPSEFEILRDRILAAPPVSACDVALQLMADTHWGACEISDEFFEQLAALSGQETVQ